MAQRVAPQAVRQHALSPFSASQILSYILLLAIWLWLTLFVLYPLANVFLGSNVASYQRILATPYYRRVILNTLALGGLTATTGTLVAFVYAYALTKVEIAIRLRRVLHFTALIPIVAPPFVFGISLILLFGTRGLITHTWLGLKNVNLYGLPGLVIVQTLAFFPFAYLLLRGLLLGLDPSLDEAGITFGGSRWTVFRRITLPLLLPGCLSAFFLIFMLSATDLGNPVFVGGNYNVLTSQIYIAVIGRFNIPMGTALAVFLLIPTLILFGLQKFLAARGSFATITGRPSRAAARIGEAHIRLPATAFCVLVAGIVVLFYAMILVGALVNIWGVDYAFTLRHFRQLFAGGWMLGMKTVRDTIFLATLASLIAGGLSLATAYAVTRPGVRGRFLIDLISTVPMAVPGIVTGLGYAIAFNKPPLVLSGTALIILAIFTVRTVPYGLRATVAALLQIDKAIEEASTVSGATEAQTMRRIFLPLIKPSFLAGLVFNFTHNLTTLSAVIFVVSAKWNLISAAMLAEIESGKIGGAAALGSLLIVMVLLLNVLSYAFIEKKDLARLEE